MGETMNTRYGAIDVTVQDGRTAYVRVGSGDHDDSTPPDAVLELPRNVAASGRAHYKLTADGWESLGPVYRLRRATGGDLTPTMAQAVDAIIIDALDGLTADQLEDAQYAKNQAEAETRRKQAAALLEMANQLNRQATELEMDRGSRVVYLRQHMRSGMDQHAIAVRTGRGELLFVDEPRGEASLNDNGLRRYMGEPAEWVERG